jgi:hypothetical protein
MVRSKLHSFKIDLTEKFGPTLAGAAMVGLTETRLTQYSQLVHQELALR